MPPRSEGSLISAIVVSYNTREMTLRCLEALLADLEGLDHEVWVVDNASSDGSADAIAECCPQVRLIRSDRNLGFGAANNRAMEQAGGDYLLLVNTDAFLQPGAARVLLAYLEEHAKTAVAGPRLLNEDGTLQVSCYRFPSPGRAWLENLWISAVLPDNVGWGDYRRWAHDRQREVDWVIGACMMVRREAVKVAGGFDEQFFMYAEETDWQRRIRNAGWRVGFTPEAEAVHLGGASGGDLPTLSKGMFDSLDYYTIKNHGLIGLISTRTAMVVGCSMRVLLWSLASLVPSRSARARQKRSLHAALVRRQLFCWSGVRRVALR